MKRAKKIIKIVLALSLLVGLYLLGSVAYNFFAGMYYKRAYKNRLAEKSALPSAKYYVSTSGNDVNDGKTERTAFQTISKINSLELNPGDSVVFKAGEIFQGSLSLDNKDLGTQQKPVTICSYGNGKAKIDAGNADGIKAVNSQGIIIASLIVTGDGSTKNTGSGIVIVNDLPGNIKLRFIRISQVEVSGFGFWGILLDGNNGKSGFTDVKISNSISHDNAEAGVYVYGKFSPIEGNFAHENVHISYVTAYNNFGKPGKNIQNTGSGIVLSDVYKGTIEHCTAYNNGSLCESTQGGPVGIWAWDSRNIIIQYNESYQNKTNGTFDGGGFDLDGGMQHSIIQYNYSHDNDGPGYLLAQFSFARKHKNNIVRYNISENDCRKNRYGVIHIWGDVEAATIYNNTLFHSGPDTSAAYAVAFRYNEDQRILDNFPSQISFFNNIFSMTGKMPFVSSPTADTSFHFVNNNYFTPTRTLSVEWANNTYNNIADWRKAARQELLMTEERGFMVDPLFINPGKGIIFNNTDSMQRFMGYSLQKNSSLLNKGIKIAGNPDLPEAEWDFNKGKIPIENFPEPGACEFLPEKN